MKTAPQGRISFLRTSLVVGMALAIGIPVGVAGYSFYFAKGFSYFSNDSRSCLNCHVMQPHFDTWSRSTHAQVTTCNSCHAPHNFVPKMLSKAENGFLHSLKFTTGKFKDPIFIRESNKKIVHANCLECHQGLFEEASHPANINCLSCHTNIGHR